MLTQNKRYRNVLLTVAVLLLIPFTAMKLTAEVNWSVFDFITMGGLLLGVGFLIEFVLRKVKNTEYRIGILAIVLVLFFLIWAELAVGIFGTPFAGS